MIPAGSPPYAIRARRNATISQQPMIAMRDARAIAKYYRGLRDRLPAELGTARRLLQRAAALPESSLDSGRHPCPDHGEGTACQEHDDARREDDREEFEGHQILRCVASHRRVMR